MSRLEDVIAGARTEGRGIFMPFLVVGDPDEETSLELSRALIRAGADILEFGFAFSDPPADGPVIQLADQRALAAGMTTDRAFDALARLREETEVPFTLLMYFNLILQYGVDAFYERCAQVGVDAVLIADVPVEECAPVVKAARDNGVAPIFIVSELTTPERLERVCEHARGYLYVVNFIGVTGERVEMQSKLQETLQTLAARCELPLMVGFGISTAEHVRAVLDAGADGAIVGSAIIRQVAEHLDDPTAMVAAVEDLGRQLAGATRAP